MGTWDTGPFDNDTAADFANTLDDAGPEEHEALIRGVLTRTVDAIDYLFEAEKAIAAAALIATQSPGGEPVDSGYGPEEPMPVSPAVLRTLAAEALDRIASDDSGLIANWLEAANARQWLAHINRLRAVLSPPLESFDIPLFDLEP
ncbi:DUF4259 domain-containing protein [Embleya sp. NPDC127516]|uniref:DUF4259 domain-containing protein n=1 Tax=Embleya sp. NPDC127516 TaxID=3363990 RepID=UPI0037F7D1D4